MSKADASARSVGGTTRVAIDGVVTHHLDGFRSGVARFNELLAESLGVPLAGLSERAHGACPLFSFKVSELGDADVLAERALAAAPTWEVFLHEYRDLELERRMVEGAQRVHCGNAEILAAVQGIGGDAQALWAPGLLRDERTFPAVEVSVFSFGMAHKLRIETFRRLKELLDASDRTYAVYVSAANHETASLRDSEAVFVEMHEIFPSELYFLGNLSDVAVFNRLATSTFFAAFFEHGVRANNTSVASAMERGAVVITNLDAYSPPELVHMHNVIDIEQCDSLPSDLVVLDGLRARAIETSRSRDWDSLVEKLR